MSRSLKIKTGLVTISVMFGSSLTLAFWERVDLPPVSSLRAPASEAVAFPSGKNMSLISVQIAPLEKIPEKETQEFAITGYVSLHTRTPGEVFYKWELPEGVELVSGDRQGSWPSMTAGQPATVTIYVTGFSKESLKHIVLQSHVRNGSDEIGNSALLSSRPEDSMEYVAPRIREYAEEKRGDEFVRGRLVK